MSKRPASNMKRARSCVDADDVNEFFDEVEKAFIGVGDVKAENVYNYDETNFTNDPGKSWVIVRRGKKRVEKVREASKQAFSVMWCGSASGKLLPPMVVYKAKTVYEGSVRNGPAGAVYDSTDRLRAMRVLFPFSGITWALISALNLLMLPVSATSFL